MTGDSTLRPSGAKHPSGIDSSVLDLLACAACLGELRFEADKLTCLKCGLGYLIVDGIAVLIAVR
jgi:uncharacterized protein YbaR (Trm112 family)